MSNLDMKNSHRYKVNQINLWRENFKIDYGYIDFYDEYSETIINKIYDLITYDKIDDSIINPVYTRYIGYYYYLKDNLEEMIKYFQKGIVKGDSQSIVELAKYHIYIDKDKSKSINLLRDAINLNNQDAMFTLAIAYNNNIYSDEEEFSKKEATKLFNKLIDFSIIGFNNSASFLRAFSSADC
jgi:TPR repeat protein